MAIGSFYVQPVNLHLVSEERSWELRQTGVGTVAEFYDTTLAHAVADMLNMSIERVREAVKRVAAEGRPAGPAEGEASSE